MLAREGGALYSLYINKIAQALHAVIKMQRHSTRIVCLTTTRQSAAVYVPDLQCIAQQSAITARYACNHVHMEASTCTICHRTPFAYIPLWHFGSVRKLQKEVVHLH
jgi:cytochrome c5